MMLTFVIVIWWKNGQAQKSWRDGIPRGYDVRDLEEVQFCGCADGTSEGPSVNFAEFIDNLIEENDVILDGQEVNEVHCSGGVIFFYEVTVAFKKDPSTLTEVEVTTFEQLFVAECNELSVWLCDPQNFLVLTAELVLSNSSRRELEELEDGSPTNFFIPLIIFAVQYKLLIAERRYNRILRGTHGVPRCIWCSWGFNRGNGPN